MVRPKGLRRDGKLSLTPQAIFSASIAVSGAFGGLIAAGVGEMSGKGGLFGWQWLVSSPRLVLASFLTPPRAVHPRGYPFLHRRRSHLLLPAGFP